MMHPRKQEFNKLRDQLDITLPEIAILICKSWSATRKYAAESDVRLPPEEVLVTMRKAVAQMQKQH